MKVWVDHFSTYIYQKRGFYYFSRRVPKEVQSLHGKQRIVLALNTRSRAKALKYSQVICQRLDERWLPMRLDAMGLGNVVVKDVKQQTAPLLSEAVGQYLQLKGIGKAKTFHQAALRNAGVVIDQLGGWSSGKVGEGYGEGFRLTQVFGALLSLRLEAKPKFHN